MARKNGFTLIEVLVAISIVALIIGLIVPAVIASRENARRIYCANNLKQIGLAMNTYESTYGTLPGPIGILSPLARITPYLEQKVLFNDTNFETSDLMANATLVNTNLSVLTCPSDSRHALVGMTNYCLNGGINNKTNAPFSFNEMNMGLVRYSEILDGLSNTAFASEWLTWNDIAQTDTRRVVFDVGFFALDAGGFAKLKTTCQAGTLSNSKIASTRKGSDWMTSGFGSTSYNHALAPGLNSCSNGSSLQYGIWSTSSSHNDVVNVVLGDGSVRTVKYTIDPALWQSLGTMNGNEVIGEY